MEHTKTPWRIGKQTGMGSVVADEPVPEIKGSDGVDYYGGHLIAESIAPRNAEFIVRACNAHDMLVKALRVIKTQSIGPDWTVEQAAEFMKQHAAETLAALAAAEAA